MQSQRLHFSINIQAPLTTIWQALWNDEAYRYWVAIFAEGSYAVTDQWKEGSRVLFLAPDKSGIFSTIKTHIPNQVMEFEHMGEVVDGKELEGIEHDKPWRGSNEKYTLIEHKDYVTLQVDIDVLNEHVDFMQDRFPQALERIKQRSL